MGKKKKALTLLEKLEKLKASGIQEINTIPKEDLLPKLNQRLQQILQIVQTNPKKNIQMTYLIMYDITDNKVRTEIAKYLLKKGCIRIQKSVYLAKSEHRYFKEILEDLKTVNSYYNNEDSIILVPVNASDVRSIKLIGKDINISTLTDSPNTLFF